MRIAVNGIVEGVDGGVRVDVCVEHAQSLLSKDVVKLRWERAEAHLHRRYLGEIKWQRSPETDRYWHMGMR